MRIGDVIESAIWINGEESQEQRQQYEADVRHAIDELCDSLGFYHGPVAFVEKRPEEDRVPDVPDHIHGIHVRLLVAEAEVTGKKPETPRGSFIANLDHNDLMRLRQITQAAYMRQFSGRVLSVEETDAVIEAIGPESALDALRRDRMH